MHGPSKLADGPIFCESNFFAESIFFFFFFFCDFEETSSFSSVQFFLCFSLVITNWQTSYDSGLLRQLGNHTRFPWSPSIGKPRTTPVLFVKTTESYEVCRRLIRGLPIGSPVWVVHLTERTETGRRTRLCGSCIAEISACCSKSNCMNLCQFLQRWFSSLAFTKTVSSGFFTALLRVFH